MDKPYLIFIAQQELTCMNNKWLQQQQQKIVYKK